MKDGKILENMQEFHKALADGETLQQYLSGRWVDQKFEFYKLDSINRRVEIDTVRIKPKTQTAIVMVKLINGQLVCLIKERNKQVVWTGWQEHEIVWQEE